MNYIHFWEMKTYNYSVFFLFILFVLCKPIIAQHDYHGCHYHKNKIKQKALTNQQKMLIQDSNARSDTFDIFHYDISIDVTNYADHFISAATTIQFSPKIDEVQSITFDLMALEVDSVVQEGNLLVFSIDTIDLTINFNSILYTSDTLELTIYYHGNPYQDPIWGGFYFESGYIYNLGIGLSTIPPNFGKVWYPCFDSFVERATYSYHVKSAGNKKAFCQGDFLGEDQLLGDTIIRHFDFTLPIPTFLSAIAVSEYESIVYEHPGEYGTIPITLTAKSNALTTMESRFVSLGDAIDALEYWYGPYIWERVGYVLTTDGALEIPTNIAYPNSMMDASNLNNGLLFSHELGHQWWGNVVTPSLHNHMWIKEGPAEYSGHLFIEWTQGEEKFIEEVKDNHLFVLEDAHIDDEGFWPLSPIPDEHIYGRHTYYKGASVMHNLRGYLGDSLFRETLHQVQENSFTSVDAEGFKTLLEEASGYDLGSFFNDWIYSPGFSTFVVDSFVSIPDGDNYITTIHLKQLLREAPTFHTNVPIELAVVNQNWEKEIYTAIVSDEYDQVIVETSFIPEIILFNPNNKLNGARMDEEAVIYPEESYNQLLNYADIRIKKNEVLDSTFIHVAHIWAAPEPEMSDNLEEISSSHYWEIKGFFSEGTDLEAKIYYHGNYEGLLDEDLVSDTEEGILPIYRLNSNLPWEEYHDYEAFQGGLTNGIGYFKLFHLKKGQYAFARGTSVVDLPEPINKNDISLFPNPVVNEILFSKLPQEEIHCTILDMKGTIVINQKLEGNRINVKNLATGIYEVILFDKSNNHIYQSTIEVNN